LSSVPLDKDFHGKYCLASVMVSIPKSFKYFRHLRGHLLLEQPFGESRFEDVNF
jgi:hypothetical protein